MAFASKFSLLSSFLLLIGTSIAGAASTTEPKVPAPIGFDVYGSEFAIVTNRQWDLAGGAAAKEVFTYRKATAGAKDAFNRQNQMYIWARTCTAAAQKVIFMRTIDMPGPPSTLAGALWATNSGYPQGESQAIINIKVFINGARVVTADGSKVTTASSGFVIPTTSQTRSLFRKGINQIKIEVNKRAQKNPFLNRCMYNSVPLGIRLTLSGRFAADLLLRGAPLQEQFFKFYSLKATMNVDRALDIVNRGPSDAHFARITVTLSGNFVTLISVAKLTNSKGPCEKSKRPTAEYIVDIACAINEVDQGAHEGPDISIEFFFNEPPPQYAVIQFFATLSSRLNDTMFSNNQVQAKMHLCGPGSHVINPKCPEWSLPPGAAPTAAAELR